VQVGDLWPQEVEEHVGLHAPPLAAPRLHRHAAARGRCAARRGPERTSTTDARAPRGGGPTRAWIS
jgi:hypothetical protein